MKRVFVSYSRHNLDVVNQLIRDLNAAGVNTWHDQTLTGGQRWWDNILSNIRDCDIFIFALSPESIESEACKSELGYVTKLGKPILPVLVADGVNVNLLSHPLAEIQVTDCRNGDKDSVFKLFKSIFSTSAPPPLPDPLPDVPPVPMSYLSNLNDRIESEQPLSSQEQITLLFELEEKLSDDRSKTEVRDLLLRLKKREDLLAKISNKIDEALNSLEEIDEKVSKIPAKPENGKEDKRLADTRFCGKCGTRATAESSFCNKCGTALSAAVETSSSDAPPPPMPGSKTRRYACDDANLPKLIAELKTWLESENFDTQKIPTENQGIMLQVKKRGSDWKAWLGMGTSLNVLFQQSGDTLSVQIGAGKWADKVGAGVVSLIILWPLAITAGYGAWEQMKMPEKIFDFIGARLSSW